MTAACRAPCCSSTPRLSASELFSRGFRRNREAPLPIEGAPIADAEGHSAAFSLALAGRTVADIRFRATSCATLIAYCEYLAETLAGLSLSLALAFSSQDLAAAVPGVPAQKQARAILAVAAFRAALAAASEIADPGERTDEGRLHLRHVAP
ncbi:MAG: iron-sulfur cluster assembly scaffold protein [Pseudorhodoplanes sp.]|nr:iron-sulfur cluster assembly scaffold protein [Pseudorhodoplanes sp.]